MKVIIIGAGISGLTVAQELINKGVKVEIYEKDKYAGGMAKSIRTIDNIPVEHSWRAYGPFYLNLFEIIKQIPINEIEGFNGYTMDDVRKHNTKDDLWTVYDNNVYDITKFVKSHPGGNIIINAGGKRLDKVWEDYGYEWHMKNSKVMEELDKYKIGTVIEEYSVKSVFDNLNKNRLNFNFLYNTDNDKKDHDPTYFDYIYLLLLFGKVILSDKRKKEYFDIRLDPLIKDALSKPGYHYISDHLAGPGYGFDKNTISLGHFATFIEYSLYQKESNWQVMNKPTSEAWIDPWVKHLKNLGVKFHFNYELVKINTTDGKVINLSFKNKDLDLEIIEGDDYVMTIDPFNLNDILKTSNMNKMALPYDKLNTNNNQISFRLGFNKKINFKIKFGGFVLVDSPYNITFYPQEDHWENVDLGMNGKIKTLISGTIILPYNKGSLTGKSGLTLSIEELKEEIIYQFFDCETFINRCIESGVSKKNIIFKEIYEDWYKKGDYLVSKNKKWVNNFMNERFRPSQKTDMDNLFISGGHCKTSISIWSMEGAIESGKITSNLILDKYNKERCFVHKHESIAIVKILSKIDNLLYKLHFKNLLIEIIIIILFLFIYERYR
jgi:uncharacterized protein with NAD-binding domain and iron-sulfur cluster